MDLLFLWIFAAIVLLQRLSELVISKRHYKKVMAMGGVESGQSHFPWMVILHVSWLVAWILESLWRGPQLAAHWYLWIGLFLAGQMLRHWAIASLGVYWNTRIIVVPGAERIHRGPYRIFPYPSYLAASIELIAVPMVFDAWITTPSDK